MSQAEGEKPEISFLAVGGAKGRGWGHLDKFPYIIIVSKTSSEEKKYDYFAYPMDAFLESGYLF